MAWKPDFTKANPYEGMPADYPARVAETFVPTAETPKSPIEDAVERGWLDPSVLIIEPVPPIPPPIVPPPEVLGLPAPTGWIGDIFSFVWDISDWFYSAYSEVSGWWWPFNYLAAPFLGIYRVLRSLLSPIAYFWAWADDVWNRVLRIFSLGEITAYFRTWIDAALDAWDWVTNSFWNVWNIVDDWWSSTKYLVLAWIDTATEGFNALRVLWDEFWAITWPEWKATLEVLGSDVSHFFTTTLPNLVDNLKLENWWGSKLFAIDGLIGSKLAEWFPFYDDVAEFFSDPGEFLLSRLTDWFLGKEE